MEEEEVGEGSVRSVITLGTGAGVEEVLDVDSFQGRPDVRWRSATASMIFITACFNGLPIESLVSCASSITFGFEPFLPRLCNS